MTLFPKPVLLMESIIAWIFFKKAIFLRIQAHENIFDNGIFKRILIEARRSSKPFLAAMPKVTV
jgi:hypothetical protein